MSNWANEQTASAALAFCARLALVWAFSFLRQAAHAFFGFGEHISLAQVLILLD